jgi:GalNAc-alpha-(1->4)-GalNAc-alpha-(1->3)-diNAcBac-PP-undecaprenol alpha-1,4-N-acetyl-D-galactosaminyltransferase
LTSPLLCGFLIAAIALSSHSVRIFFSLRGSSVIQRSNNPSLAQHLASSRLKHVRIAFVLPTFRAGGAERVASLLCNFWVDHGHSVAALMFEAPGADQVCLLDERIVLRQFDVLNRSKTLKSIIGTNLRRLGRLRAALKAFEPDVIVAFTTEANVVALWSALGLGVPVIVSERNQPDRPGLGLVRRGLRRLSYPLAAAIVVQTQAIAGWAKERFRVPVEVLPNPVRLQDACTQPLSEENAPKRVIAVGRLVRQKGFDLLIRAFANMAARHLDWSLAIYGEGDERSALEAEIAASGLSERISLEGVCKEMDGVYRGADLFVLPSRFEGYPNALIEALAAGCPVVTTDCPGATAEILVRGRYGLLVPPESADALASALDRMMSDASLRAHYAARAREAVLELDVAIVGRRWLDLLTSVTEA